MATTVSGIYLHLDGTTSQLLEKQSYRELAFNNTESQLRYIDCSGTAFDFPNENQVNSYITNYVSGMIGQPSGLVPLNDSGIIDSQYLNITFPVISVNSQSGNVLLTTNNIQESGSNYYFTQTRARQSLSGITPINYNQTTGEISVTVGTTSNTVAAGDHIHNSGIGMHDSSTGVIDFDGVSSTIGGTTFNVGAIKSFFVDNTTDSLSPTVTYKAFNAVSGIALTYLTSNIVTYVGVDINGNIIQQTTPFTQTQTRDIIPLGNVVHSNKTTVNAVNQGATFIQSPINQLVDLATAIGIFNIDGNDISAGGANLTIQKSEGAIFKIGSNAISDPKDPNTLTLNAIPAPATLRYRTQTSTETTNRTTIITDFYDLNGTVTAVNTNKWTIQRIAIFPSNAIRIQYGQTVYNNKAEALANITTESFVVEDNINQNGIFRAHLVIKSGATDLTDIESAIFIPTTKFGGVTVGSTSTTTLQQAYDNSTEPEILTNDTRGAISFKQGGSSNTVVEVIDNLGNTDISLTTSGINLTTSGKYTKNNYQWVNEYNGTEKGYYSYNNSTRVYTFNSGGTSIYWINGIRYTTPSNTTTITHGTEINVHYIYIDSSNQLQTSTTLWDITANNIPLLAVYWTGSIGIPLYELHNHTRSRDWHANAHTSIGTKAQELGFALTNINVDDTTPTTAELKYGISEGWLKDEDIKMTLSALSSGGSDYNILYRNSAVTTSLGIINKTMPFSWGTTYIQYNDKTTGTFVEVSSNRWVNYFILALPVKSSHDGSSSVITSDAYRFLLVPGQTVHTSLANAQTEEFWSLDMGDLANFSEWTPLYRITYRTSSGFSNATGRVVVDEWKRYYETRVGIQGLGATTTIHNGLLGRDAIDSHPITAITGTADYLAAFDSSGNGTSLIKSTFALASHNQTWSTITSTPTTLSGYGITDATPSGHIGSTGSAHGNATVSVAGFMSSADKTKLDGIATGANLYVHPNHSGDVTSVGDGATTIASNVVTNAKLAQVNTQTFKGRNTASTGNVEDLTVATVKTMLNLSGTNSGDQTITLTGDVTGSGTGSFETTLATISQSTGSNFVKISLDTKGRVTGNTAISASDINGLFSATTTNYIYASPNGSSGTPSFRALVANDIPSLSGIYALTSHTHAYTALTGGTVGQIPFATSNTAFSSSSNLFWDNTNGYLGVGTSSPAYTLDVNGTIATNSFLRVVNSSSTAYNTSGTVPTVYGTYLRNEDATAGAENRYILDRKIVRGTDDSTYDYMWDGLVAGDTLYSPKYIWGARIASTSYNEIMRLDANAGSPMLGIGTTAPTYTLDVNGIGAASIYWRVNKETILTSYSGTSTVASDQIAFYAYSTDTTPATTRSMFTYYRFYGIDQTVTQSYAWTGVVGGDTVYNPKFVWGGRVGPSTSIYKELMRLDVNAGSPRLGIGTTAPAYTLDVNGTCSISGVATLGGNAYPTTNGTSGHFLKTNGAGTLSWASPKPTLTKTIVIESPGAAENISIFRNDVAITVSEVNAVITGTTSVTYQLYQGTSRATGTAIMTSSSIANSSTSGVTVISFSAPGVVANSWIWIATSGISGTPTSLTVDIRYTED